MIDLRKENVAEDMEEKHYLVMPFNNKWYKLKIKFDSTYTYATNNKVLKRCRFVYRNVCSDYANKNIAIMEIETGKTFVFNSQYDRFGNLVKITCNDFSQFKQMN